MLARRAALTLAVVGVAMALSGTAAAQGLSPVVDQVEALFAIVLALALIVGLVVYGTLAFVLIRFRRSRSSGTAHPVEGNLRLEAAWSAIPALLLVGLTVLSTQTLLFIDTNPKNVPVIDVIAQQWFWTFDYPDGRKNMRELWIERGVTFLFNITSRDVIHSFYLPEFEIKKDAVPGLNNFLWLRPDRTGQFHTQCAEYCGLGHSDMIANVFVFEHQSGRPPYGPPLVPPQPTSVGVSLEELGPSSFAIRPSTLNFTLNEFVRLRVHNNGTAVHNFTIDAPYDVWTGPISGSASRDLFLNLTSATGGTAYGGDAMERANGMAGTLVVSGGDFIDITLSGGGSKAFLIDPTEIHRRVGDVVTFRIHNVGDLAHNFTLGDPGGPYYLKQDSLIQAGQIVTLGPITLSKEARVKYICAIPGHAQAGMIGYLIVGNPSVGLTEVTYPFFGFAVSTLFIGGFAGFAYVVHHARSGTVRGRRNREH